MSRSAKSWQAVRGMRDVLPTDARRQQVVEDSTLDVLQSFAYERIDLPLLEFTDLFARGVGEATDIVEKEMYSLDDRDGDSLTLRPEGTAGCVRALNEHGLLYNQTQRVYYAGPMFRYEKPQKGRYRQFSQIGAEAFGFVGPDIDAELIALCAAFWNVLGITDHVELQVNTLGSGVARAQYREALVAYLTPLQGDLDEDSVRRLSTNPLRILDSKNEQTQAVLKNAPTLLDYVDEDATKHFNGLLQLLDDLGIAYRRNPNLVRGLDYYTNTVFEWVTTDLGAQGTICAGGRYDGLVERLGGKPTPAAGFAMGVDRVALLHQTVHQDFSSGPVDIFICPLSESVTGSALKTADLIRHRLPAAGTRLNMGASNLKKQLKRADATGAAIAVLLGEQEVAAEQLTLKNLRTGEQVTHAIDEAVTLAQSWLAS